MPLSITCTCGAKLEIDDKFAGKVITCPDCQRSVATAPEPIQAARTSACALASLALALLGPLTLVLPLLAIGFGMVALRHIARHPADVGGRRFASAGMILGGVFSCLSVAAYFWPGMLRADGIFREIEWAGKLDFSVKSPVEVDRGDENLRFSIDRPRPSWGKTTQRLRDFSDVGDDLILVDPWDDAQVTCLNETYPYGGEDKSIVLNRAVERFLKSELVHYLGAVGKKNFKTSFDEKKDKERSAQDYERVLDLNVGGPQRTFVLRVIAMDGFKLFIVAGGTRSAHFARMETELREIVSSYKVSTGR